MLAGKFCSCLSYQGSSNESSNKVTSTCLFVKFLFHKYYDRGFTTLLDYKEKPFEQQISVRHWTIINSCLITAIFGTTWFI
jgi:hypothetical protein